MKEPTISNRKNGSRARLATLPFLFALALLLGTVTDFARFQGAGTSGGFRGEIYMKTPTLLATGPTEWVATGQGVIAYGGGRELVLALDSTPLQPVAKLRLENAATGAVFFGRYAYLAEPGLGLRVIDASVPETPVQVGLVPLPDGAIHMAALGDKLLVSLDRLGVKVFSIGDGMAMGLAMDPLDMREAGFLPLEGRFTAFAASSSRAYLAVEGDGLAVIDLADASRPTLAEAVQMGFPIDSLAVSGDLLYASSSQGGLRVLDPQNLSSGAPLAHLPDVSGSLEPTGRILYVASPSKGLLSVETGSAASQTVNVNVGSIFFQPATVNINSGDTVKWTWVGGSHSSTSGSCAGGNCNPDGTWDSGVKSSGTFTHLFSGAGNNPYFCSVHQSSQTGVVKVAGGPSLLSASSSASVTAGPAPLQVRFTGTAAGGTAPYTYAWDFGDSGSASDQNPDHTYNAVGTYTAVLTVHDSAGGSVSAAPITITVGNTTVSPPTVTAMKKLGGPFRITVTGSNFQSGVETFINGAKWTNVTYGGVTTLTLNGGKSLKSAVPKNTPTLFKFDNPDGGEATFTFRWP